MNLLNLIQESYLFEDELKDCFKFIDIKFKKNTSKVLSKFVKVDIQNSHIEEIKRSYFSSKGIKLGSDYKAVIIILDTKENGPYILNFNEDLAYIITDDESFGYREYKILDGVKILNKEKSHIKKVFAIQNKDISDLQKQRYKNKSLYGTVDAYNKGKLSSIANVDDEFYNRYLLRRYKLKELRSKKQ